MQFSSGGVESLDDGVVLEAELQPVTWTLGGLEYPHPLLMRLQRALSSRVLS